MCRVICRHAGRAFVTFGEMRTATPRTATTKPETKRYYPTPALEKGLDILELFAIQPSRNFADGKTFRRTRKELKDIQALFQGRSRIISLGLRFRRRSTRSGGSHFTKGNKSPSGMSTNYSAHPSAAHVRDSEL